MDLPSFPAMLMANISVGPYEQIRDDIIAGNLLPDAKLKIRVLRHRYKTGTSPLREALSKLAAEGLAIRPRTAGSASPPPTWPTTMKWCKPNAG